MTIPPRPFTESADEIRRVPHGWDVTVRIRGLELPPMDQAAAAIVAVIHLADTLAACGVDVLAMLKQRARRV